MRTQHPHHPDLASMLPLHAHRTRAGAWALSLWAGLAITTASVHAANPPVTSAPAPAAAQADAASAAVQIMVERQKQARKDAASRKEPVVEIDERDPAMRAAFKAAQASLDDFLKVAASDDPKYTHVSMRVTIREGKRKEFIWITPFEADGKGFKGLVDNAPTLLKRVKDGQEWRFKRQDVVDWMYVDASTRVMHGNRTTCVQLAKAPPAEAEQIKRAYGLDCQTR